MPPLADIGHEPRGRELTDILQTLAFRPERCRFVEEHGDAQFVPDAPAHRTGDDFALMQVGVVQRDEGNDVRRAETGMHSGVSAQIDFFNGDAHRGHRGIGNRQR